MDVQKTLTKVEITLHEEKEEYSNEVNVYEDRLAKSHKEVKYLWK